MYQSIIHSSTPAYLCQPNKISWRRFMLKEGGDQYCHLKKPSFTWWSLFLCYQWINLSREWHFAPRWVIPCTPWAIVLSSTRIKITTMIIQQLRWKFDRINFVTIDSETTQDMDDVPCIFSRLNKRTTNGWQLVVGDCRSYRLYWCELTNC